MPLRSERLEREADDLSESAKYVLRDFDAELDELERKGLLRFTVNGAAMRAFLIANRPPEADEAS